ncbi:CpaD family pilus assembly protein [Pararhodobacter sp.]|uniref:CpaD family pilus assembly protein n=1 Tax=Pararhodobacter sp. TaxID=2127056 RepID=UPI002AFF0A28|nr:CpaD family pilus assembly protein [Pararhodobacter sp.]
MRPTLSRLRFLSLALAGMALSGCAADQFWNEPPYPAAYQERHPIQFTDAPKRLEVFPRWARGLDARQRSDVTDFANQFRKSTKTQLWISVPVIPEDAGDLLDGKRPSGHHPNATPQMLPAVKTTLADVRQTLARAGVSPRHVLVSTYPGTYSEAPITLTFDAFTANVPNKCGEWPQDLAAGAGAQGWWNETYWNFGCASQSNLAAQTAEPLDLLRPRQQSPADAVRAVNNINELRQGQDPSTKYDAARSIAQEVGN